MMKPFQISAKHANEKIAPPSGVSTYTEADSVVQLLARVLDEFPLTEGYFDHEAVRLDAKGRPILSGHSIKLLPEDFARLTYR